MSFHEIELDRENCLEATGGPIGRTVINVAYSGKETRLVRWPTVRYSYTIQYVARATSTKFRNLLSFILARKHNAYGFRLYDWTDHDDWGNGRVALVNGVYRLVKDYDDSINPYTRIITKPINGTVVLSGVGGTPVIDYTTGIVSGASSTGTWTGEFNVPVRFNFPEGQEQAFYRVVPSGEEEFNVFVDNVPLIELL